jgi:hypothetical protein
MNFLPAPFHARRLFAVAKKPPPNTLLKTPPSPYGGGVLSEERVLVMGIDTAFTVVSGCSFQ